MFSRRRDKKGITHFVRQKLDVYNSTVPFVQVLQWWYASAQAQVAQPEESAFLLPEAFSAYTKISIEDYHISRPHLPQAFKFKDYCPSVYADLRRRLGISPSDLFKSLVEGEVMRVTDGVRYMTHDRHFRINLLSREEVTDILRLLRSYQEHVVNQAGATLLPHWAALHRIVIKTKLGGEEKPVYVLVERNSLPFQVDSIYHLKGCKAPVKEKPDIKRLQHKKRSKEDIELPIGMYPTPLHDSEFESNSIKLAFPKEIGDKLMAMLKTDVEYLKQRKMMDYAVVVGVLKFRVDEIPGIDANVISHFFPGVESKMEHYFISMEGFGSIYGARKRLEGFAHAHNSNASKGGSKEPMSIKPEKYACRFLQFMSTAIEIIETNAASTTKTFELLVEHDNAILVSPRDLQERFFERRKSFQQERAVSGDDSGGESSGQKQPSIRLRSRPNSTGSDSMLP